MIEHKMTFVIEEGEATFIVEDGDPPESPSPEKEMPVIYSVLVPTELEVAQPDPIDNNADVVCIGDKAE